jgi:hypothetical protein
MLGGDGFPAFNLRYRVKHGDEAVGSKGKLLAALVPWATW